jgi:hypothetical protein
MLDVSSFLSEAEWAEGTLECLKAAKRVVKKGRSPGSLEPEETAGLDYWVADGFDVHQAAPQFSGLYRNPAFKVALERTVGVGLELDPDERSRVSVNVLTAGKNYEEHVDGCGITAVVFLTHCFGGQLEVQEDGGWLGYSVNPGKMIALDGSRVPHRVQVVERGVRVTLLLSYRVRGRHEERDPGLSAAIYGAE